MSDNNYDLKKCLCCGENIKFENLFSKVKLLHSNTPDKEIESLQKEGFQVDANTVVIKCPTKGCTLSLLSGVPNNCTLRELKEDIVSVWNKRSSKDLQKDTCPSCGGEQIFEEHESIHKSHTRKQGMYTVNCYSKENGMDCGLSLDVDIGLNDEELTEEKAKLIVKETFQFLNKNKNK